MSATTKLVHFVLIVFTMGTSLSVGARGGESSGGGSTYYMGSSTTLWDFLNLDYHRKHGERPVQTLSLEVYKFDLVSHVFPQVYRETRDRLERFLPRNPALARSLKGTLDRLPLIYLEAPIDIRGFAVSPESLSQFGFQQVPPQLKMAALFFENHGSFFFPHIVNLDFDGQVGLILHELLRHTQITGNLSTFQVEELTRVITFRTPVPAWVNEVFSRRFRMETQYSPPLSETQAQIATLSLKAIAQRCQNSPEICFDGQEKKNVETFIDRLIEVLPQLSALKPTD